MEVRTDETLFEILDACFETQLEGGTGKATVPCAYGKPGIGKTQRVVQYAKWKAKQGSKALGIKKMKTHVHTIILGQGANLDIGGAWAPNFDTQELTHFIIRDILGFIDGVDADMVIVHLDEAGNAGQENLIAIQSALEDSMIRGKMKSKGCVYCLSSNRPEDGTGAKKLPKSMTDGRIVSFDLVPDPNQWLEDFAEPNGIDVRIRAAIAWRGSLLHQHDVKSRDPDPTPRGWEKLSHLLARKLSPSATDVLASGCVGEGAWREAKGFIQLSDDLPEYLDILADPESAHIPGTIDKRNGPSGQWAVVTNIAYEVGNLNRKLYYEEAEAIAIYLDRLDDEYTVFGARECAAVSKEFANTKKFGELKVKHSPLQVFNSKNR